MGGGAPVVRVLSGRAMTERLRVGWAVVFAAGALAALSVGQAIGDVHSHQLNKRITAWVCAAGFLVLAVLAIRSIVTELRRVLRARAGESAASAIGILTTFIGYVVTLFIGLDLVGVPVQHLLIGGALTGVVLGIALQQVLGNVFAGLVLLFVRPFAIGDHIYVRSGSINGPFDGVVTDIDLTYVTVIVEGRPCRIPNSAMLGSAVAPYDPI